MIERVASAPLAERRLIAVDLIGDLDGELAATLVDTLGELRRHGDCDVLLNLKRVANMDGNGIAGASKAIAELRLSGSSISVLGPRNRHVRALLHASRIDVEKAPSETTCARHIMIARHSRSK